MSTAASIMPTALTREVKIDGIGACRMTFYVRGPKGVVQFVIDTGWHLHRQFSSPTAWDLGWHSPVPHRWGGTRMKKCHLFDNKECYYDGSTLNAEEPLTILIREGSDKLWEYLESYYKEVFES